MSSSFPIDISLGAGDVVGPITLGTLFLSSAIPPMGPVGPGVEAAWAAQFDATASPITGQFDFVGDPVWLQDAYANVVMVRTADVDKIVWSTARGGEPDFPISAGGWRDNAGLGGDPLAGAPWLIWSAHADFHTGDSPRPWTLTTPLDDTIGFRINPPYSTHTYQCAQAFGFPAGEYTLLAYLGRAGIGSGNALAEVVVPFYSLSGTFTVPFGVTFPRSSEFGACCEAPHTPDPLPWRMIDGIDGLIRGGSFHVEQDWTPAALDGDQWRASLIVPEDLYGSPQYGVDNSCIVPIDIGHLAPPLDWISGHFLIRKVVVDWDWNTDQPVFFENPNPDTGPDPHIAWFELALTLRTETGFAILSAAPDVGGAHPIGWPQGPTMDSSGTVSGSGNWGPLNRTDITATIHHGVEYWLALDTARVAGSVTAADYAEFAISGYAHFAFVWEFIIDSFKNLDDDTVHTVFPASEPEPSSLWVPSCRPPTVLATHTPPHSSDWS